MHLENRYNVHKNSKNMRFKILETNITYKTIFKI